MTKAKPLQNPVFFFRGLNTRGDENLRFGRLALGPMHAPWLRQLDARKISAYAITGRGGGRLQEQVERAKQTILSLPIWQTPGTRFHFLAHSTGGLVARALVHELAQPSRVLSVTTIASPHGGARLADLLPTLPARRPRLNRLLHAFDYRIEEKVSTFSDLTKSQINNFNLAYPDIPGVQYGSAVFSMKEADLSWPVQLVRRMVLAGRESTESDGIVDRLEQHWGQVFHEAALDHMNQIGYNLRLNPRLRWQAKKEFLRLVDKAVEFMQLSERPPLHDDAIN